MTYGDGDPHARVKRARLTATLDRRRHAVAREERRPDRNRPGQRGFAGLIRARDERTVGSDDGALAAIHDAAGFDADLVGRNERHAVLERAHGDHQIGLHVFEQRRVAPAAYPGRRYHQNLRSAVDQGAGNRRDAPVGAHHDAQASRRCVDGFETFARMEPAAIEMPKKKLVGGTGDAVARYHRGRIVVAPVFVAAAAADDGCSVGGGNCDEVLCRAFEQFGFDRFAADNVSGNGSFGKNDQFRAGFGRGAGARADLGPTFGKVAAIVCAKLQQRNGPRTSTHERITPIAGDFVRRSTHVALLRIAVKRLLACVSLVAATTTAALSAAPPATKPTTKPSLAHKKAPPIRVAPADEYFGKLKMSVLGIRNTIKDVGANLDIDQTRWTQLASKAAFAEDAMRDWEKKYPQDTWLAKTVFALERMYAKLDNDDGRKRSLATMTWLIHDFPKTWYGRTGRTELAQGKVGRSAQTASAAASPAPRAIRSPRRQVQHPRNLPKGRAAPRVRSAPSRPRAALPPRPIRIPFRRSLPQHSAAEGSARTAAAAVTKAKAPRSASTEGLLLDAGARREEV